MTAITALTTQMATKRSNDIQLMPTPVDLAILEPQAQIIHLQTFNTNNICNTREEDENEDEGEEIRPIPLNTNDLNLHIQNAIHLDHNYSKEIPYNFVKNYKPISALEQEQQQQQQHQQEQLVSVENTIQQSDNISMYEASPTISTTISPSTSIFTNHYQPSPMIGSVMPTNTGEVLVANNQSCK